MNFRFIAALSLLSTSAFAQVPILIDAGSSADSQCGVPTITYKYTTVALSQQSGVYRTLCAAYPGKAIDYDLIVNKGSCGVTLNLIEPRPAGTDPASTVAVGLRVFTVTVNSVASPPIDIFAAKGSLTPYDYPLQPVQVTDNHLRIHLAATSVLVPVVSGILANCTPPPPPSASKPQPPETFPVPAGQKITVTLAKTPDPAYPMLLSFITSYFGEQYTAFLLPEASATLEFTPPPTAHDGTLKVLYWSAQ